MGLVNIIKIYNEIHHILINVKLKKVIFTNGKAINYVLCLVTLKIKFEIETVLQDKHLVFQINLKMQ